MTEPTAISEILAELEHAKGRFPREAVEGAIARREEVTPHLLVVLENTADTLRRFGSDGIPDTYIAHLYAFFLLAQFRETRAYRLVIRFFAQPGDDALDATGDFVTENLGRVLASLFDGDLQPIRDLIEDSSLNEYVRGAALRALVVLAAVDRIPRSDVIEYYRDLFRGRLGWAGADGDRVLQGILVSESLNLHATELRPEVELAFAQKRVDELFVDLRSARRSWEEPMERTMERLRHPRRLLIGDTVAEMEWWACFREEDNRSISARADREDDLEAPIIGQEAPMIDQEHGDVRPATSAAPKVGRNQLCPCRSGKKYKKCCGSPV